MNILLTNDDGPPGQNSPFIVTFIKHLAKLGTVTTVIPATQKSWIGKGIIIDERISHTYYDPPSGLISNNPLDGSWHLLTATPAACVDIALNHLGSDFDLCISGPNFGRNTGTGSSISSGTMGAAIEFAIHGERSIALSFAYSHKSDTECAESIENACVHSMKTIRWLLEKWDQMDPCPEMFSINIPLIKTPYENVKLTKFFKGSYSSLFQKDGKQFVFNPTFQMLDPQPDTDMWCILNKSISVTPMNASFEVVGLSADSSLKMSKICE